MRSLEEIKAPVTSEIERYEKFVAASFKSDNTLVTSMMTYILGSRGKGIRPLTALLSARLIRPQGELPERSMIAAMLLEMIHTATLVHDDVIDEAYTRRGRASVNALWHSHRSVLIGDYILAKSYELSMNNGAYDIVTLISGVMSEICDGELLQSDQTDKLEMTKELYETIIHKKTAILFGASCAAGALSVDASREAVAKLTEFGNNLGMTFQIKDDILDFMPLEQTGKPACGDIRERKITLPIIKVLEVSGPKERKLLLDLMSDIRNNPENADKICDIIHRNQGIELATRDMDYYISRAVDILSGFSESPYKASLSKLCRFVADRTH